MSRGLGDVYKRQLREPVQIHAVPGGMSMLIRILTNIIKQLKVLLESA